jgi:Pectate lyase superfamily protein
MSALNRHFRGVTLFVVVLVGGLIGAPHVAAHWGARGVLAAARTGRGPVPVSPPARRIRPERFGAVGNGVANDTAALQTAIDLARGRIVWLSPNRTYIITRELHLKSGTTIEGAGPTSVLRFTWFDGKGPASGGKFYLANKARQHDSHITLANFVIIGGASGQPSGLNRYYPEGLAAAVRLNNVDHFSMTHLAISNTPAYAIGEFGSRQGTISDNYIHNTGRGGIGMWWFETDTSQVTVTHNLLRRLGDDAIAVNGLPARPWPPRSSSLPTQIQIVDNAILGWPTNVNGRSLGNGIALYGVHGVTVRQNNVHNTYGAGILVVGCGHSRCASNSRVPFRTSSNVAIVSNTVTGAGHLYAASDQNQPNIPTDGIFIRSTRNSVVKGNRIWKARRAKLNSRCQGCSVTRG